MVIERLRLIELMARDGDKPPDMNWAVEALTALVPVMRASEL